MCACASVKVSAEVKGVGFPGDGVTDGCESLMLVLGAKHGSSEKKTASAFTCRVIISLAS